MVVVSVRVCASPESCVRPQPTPSPVIIGESLGVPANLLNLILEPRTVVEIGQARFTIAPVLLAALAASVSAHLLASILSRHCCSVSPGLSCRYSGKCFFAYAFSAACPLGKPPFDLAVCMSSFHRS